MDILLLFLIILESGLFVVWYLRRKSSTQADATLITPPGLAQAQDAPEAQASQALMEHQSETQPTTWTPLPRKALLHYQEAMTHQTGHGRLAPQRARVNIEQHWARAAAQSRWVSGMDESLPVANSRRPTPQVSPPEPEVIAPKVTRRRNGLESLINLTPPDHRE